MVAIVASTIDVPQLELEGGASLCVVSRMRGCSQRVAGLRPGGVIGRRQTLSFDCAALRGLLPCHVWCFILVHAALALKLQAEIRLAL